VPESQRRNVGDAGIALQTGMTKEKMKQTSHSGSRSPRKLGEAGRDTGISIKKQ
jgi:hypothetical protein